MARVSAQIKRLPGLEGHCLNYNDDLCFAIKDTITSEASGSYSDCTSNMVPFQHCKCVNATFKFYFITISLFFLILSILIDIRFDGIQTYAYRKMQAFQCNLCNFLTVCRAFSISICGFQMSQTCVRDVCIMHITFAFKFDLG